jgi:hypothetical protein
MSISLQCPGCRRILTVPVQMAGQQARCSACTKLFLVPALTTPPVPTAAAPVASFDFTDPNPDAKFNFEAESPQDQSYRDYDGDPAAWRSTAAGLKNLWLGSSIQLLALLGYLAGMIFVQVLAVNVAEGFDKFAASRAGRGQDDSVIVIGETAAYWLMVVGTLAGGALRVAGLGRCLAVPSESGGKALVAGALLSEVGAWIAAASLYLPYVAKNGFPLLLMIGYGGAVLLSLILLLVFLAQLGAAFDSRQLPRRVLNFAIWVVAGPAAIGLIFVAGALFRGAGYVPVGFGLFQLLAIILTPCILIFKYLGLLSLASEEIRRRMLRGQRV